MFNKLQFNKLSVKLSGAVFVACCLSLRSCAKRDKTGESKKSVIQNAGWNTMEVYGGGSSNYTLLLDYSTYIGPVHLISQ